MPIPINKVNYDNFGKKQSQFDMSELMNLIPLIQINPNILKGETKEHERDKDEIKKIWLNSSDLGNDKIEINPSVSERAVENMQLKGYIEGNKGIYKITNDGKRVLKEAILEDEESEFCKQASKQMVSKNSYDFGEEVLVKVNHPERFGARYITIPRKVFSNKKLKPIQVKSSEIKTRKSDGSLKELKDYSDEELIKVLHLSKKIIKNASKIAEQKGINVPVNRIRCFADFIMDELNDKR